MQRQRIIKFVANVEVTREDWGFKAVHPTLGTLATAETEAAALEKLDKMIAREVEFGLVHGNLKFVKPAKAGR